MAALTATLLSNPTQEPVVVVLKTKTVEKITHLNLAAREQRFPILFFGLNDIRDAFQSAPEDTGDSKTNARQKAFMAQNADADCQKEGPYRDALKKLVESHGVILNPKRTIFGSEDSTLHIPLDAWKKMRPKLEPIVPEELLRKAEGPNGDLPGFGAETGHLLAAVGIPRMMHYLYEAGIEAGYGGRPLYMTDRVDLIFRLLSENTSVPMTELQVETGLCLTKEGLEAGDRLKTDEDIVLTTHYLSHAYAPQTAAASNHEQYIRYLSHVSPRSATVRAIAKHFGLQPQHVECECEAPKVDRPVARVSRMDSFVYTPENERSSAEGQNLGERTYRLLDISPWLNAHDAIIFKPFDAGNLALKRRAYYALSAAIVAKQTEAEHMKKPLIVLDDGCYADFRKMEMILSNNGMVKNFRVLPAFSAVKHKPVMPVGILHKPTLYVDYIATTDKGRSFDHALREVVGFRAQEYRRYQSPGDLGNAVEYMAGFDSLTMDRYGVADYLSAGNQNKYLLDRNYALGEFVARNGISSVYGGGDDYAMGAFYRGSKDLTGTHIVAFSTPSIVKSETKDGYLPQTNVWGLCHNTSERRTQFMLWAHSHVVSWGGIGTFEEMLSFAVCRDHIADYANRQMIVDARPIHGKGGNINPFAFPAIGMMFGADNARKTVRDHDAMLHEHGVVVATKPNEVERRILAHRSKFRGALGQKTWRLGA